MQFIDTHCHIDLIQEKAGLTGFSETLQFMSPLPQAIIQVACHPESFGQTLPYLDDPRIFAAFGVHPHEASLYSSVVEGELKKFLAHPKAVACGEMGLDYHYDFSPREIQRTVFEQQLALAKSLQKPIVLHTREAEADTLAILRNTPLHGQSIHVHCYTGDLAFAKSLLDLDAQVFFGFTGILTFKTAEEIRRVAAFLPEDRLLTETDAPFLAPIPHRGKTAHPGMIGLVLQALANARGVSADHLAPICLANAKRFYGI
jgi:TatD DNase family protein